MSQKLAYTVREAAALLSLSRSRVYELVHSGLIQSVKVGRSRRFTEDQLLQFLRNHQTTPSLRPPEANSTK
ncbi:MAG: helix-turn-helix domain-containing protein [Fimbriimonadaceae bacterium]|nr:helix-turn-helix domain-containing protein [Fimbriimonadaceae bacterium]